MYISLVTENPRCAVLTQLRMSLEWVEAGTQTLDEGFWRSLSVAIRPFAMPDTTEVEKHNIILALWKQFGPLMYEPPSSRALREPSTGHQMSLLSITHTLTALAWIFRLVDDLQYSPPKLVSIEKGIHQIAAPILPLLCATSAHNASVENNDHIPMFINSSNGCGFFDSSHQIENINAIYPSEYSNVLDALLLRTPYKSFEEFQKNGRAAFLIPLPLAKSTPKEGILAKWPAILTRYSALHNTLINFDGSTLKHINLSIIPGDLPWDQTLANLDAQENLFRTVDTGYNYRPFKSREEGLEWARQIILMNVRYFLDDSAKITLGLSASDEFSLDMPTITPLALSLLQLYSELQELGRTGKECKCGCGRIVVGNRIYYDKKCRNRLKESRPNRKINSWLRTLKSRNKLSEEKYLELRTMAAELLKHGESESEVRAILSDLI